MKINVANKSDRRVVHLAVIAIVCAIFSISVCAEKGKICCEDCGACKRARIISQMISEYPISCVWAVQDASESVRQLIEKNYIAISFANWYTCLGKGESINRDNPMAQMQAHYAFYFNIIVRDKRIAEDPLGVIREGLDFPSESNQLDLSLHGISLREIGSLDEYKKLSYQFVVDMERIRYSIHGKQIEKMLLTNIDEYKKSGNISWKGPVLPIEVTKNITH